MKSGEPRDPTPKSVHPVTAAVPPFTAGELRVRAAYPRDVRVLVDFNRAMARETEGKELDPNVLQAGVQGVFADAARGQYFLAEEGRRAVGSLLVTHEWSDWRNGVFWWIQSVYIEPEFRRQGVFRALYEHVFDSARQSHGVVGLRLYVERDNTSAQAVYEKVGMTASRYSMFEVDFVLESGDRSSRK